MQTFTFIKKIIHVLTIILVLSVFGACKKKSTDVTPPVIVVQDTTGLSGLNDQLKGDWRFADFSGAMVFYNPKNGLRSKPISIQDMLDTFNKKFGNGMAGDSLSFRKNNALGGLLYGVSHLIVYCPYGENGDADGAYTTYKMVNEGGKKVQIQWTYWKKNGSNFDTTHVVPYDLPLAQYSNSSLEIELNQSSFNKYTLGTEQLGSNIIMLLFLLTDDNEYKRVGFDTYTNVDLKTYSNQIFEVNVPIKIHMTKIR